MQTSSELLYGGKLEAAPSNANILLRDLPSTTFADEVAPLHFVDTTGAGYEEEEEESSELSSLPQAAELLERSRINRGEAEVRLFESY